MDQRRRVSLYDPAFAGRLRHTPARPVYRARSTAMARPVPPVVAPVPVAALPKLVAPAQPPRQPQKSVVLHRSAVRQPNWLDLADPIIETPVSKLRHWQPMVLYGLAIMLFVVGLTVALNGLRTNRKVAAQVQHVTNSVKSDDDSGAHPSTQQPSAASVASYVVAPNLPRYIDIPKLAVHARTLSMGVTSSNQLKAPGNVYDAGWYNASAQPGQPGAMLVDGHISSWTTKGVFYGLNKLAAGDKITITRGDGQTFTYTVVKTELDDAKTVDMSSLLVSKVSSKPGLNLISCSGDVIPGSNEFDKRLVVYAVMQ